MGFVMYVGAVNFNASKKLDAQQALHARTQQQFDAVALGNGGARPEAPRLLGHRRGHLVRTCTQSTVSVAGWNVAGFGAPL